MYFIFYVFFTDRTDPLFRFLIRSYIPEIQVGGGGYRGLKRVTGAYKKLPGL